MDKFEKYHKFHRMTLSYAEAEKYIAVGWTLENVQRRTLRGIDREYEQCALVWQKDSDPIIPADLD